jgi:threonylcarbamoyladenosine tRNA methylthiotransferase CDKAL1
MPKVYIETYGCTLNQADSDIMRALLKHEIVGKEQESDVVVLNTCTVKGPTENRMFERIKSLKDRGLVVAGCLAANESRIRKIAPLAPILWPSSLKKINDAVDSAMKGLPATYKDGSKEGLPKIFTPPIARIPINDGCTSSCHFCQTKFARPALQSYSPKTIVEWINESVRLGAREIQLTSMDLGAYGLDIGTSLAELLGMISQDDSRFLVRLGMINPNHAKRMLPEILSALNNQKFYKFLHLPVQTGSEKVCKEMNRDHTVKDFVDIVAAARKEIPEITIATDIIIGYPTETREDFNQTRELLRQIKPDVVNLSKFSARPGTNAKKLKQLDNREIKARSREASGLVKEICLEKRKSLIGRSYDVLMTERQRDFTGRNINYTQVVVKDFKGQLGDFVKVKIIDANHGCVFGKMED